MNLDELKKQIKKVHNKRMRLMGKKSADYATDDTLSNFKRMWFYCTLLDIDVQRSAEDCARFLMMLKIDRLGNLKRKGVTPKNESIEDTILDLHNYLDISHACAVEDYWKRVEGGEPRPA